VEFITSGKTRNGIQFVGRRTRIFLIIAVAAVLFTGPASAIYGFDGVPFTDRLTGVTHGTVKGGVYIDGGDGLPNAKSSPYTRTFEVPEGTVKWARFYVGVWGGTEKKDGRVEVTFNDRELDKIDIKGENDGNPSVYCSGYGVYWIAYDVTSNTTSGKVNAAEVKTSGSIDGRVYGVVLVAIYEDPEGEDVDYWVSAGNVNLHGAGWSGTLRTANSEALAEFPGSIDVDKFTAARLTAVYLTGTYGLNDYLYFNDKKLCDGQNCNDIANSRSYFDFKTFDVKEYLKEEDNKAKFELGDEDYVHPVLAVLTLHTKPEGDSDLTVSGISVPALYAGKSSTITGVIENIGKDSAFSFQAALYADGEIVSTASVSSLAPAKNRSVDFSWKPASEGKHVLWVYADYNDRKTELRETNNNNTPLTVNVIDFTPPEIKIDKPGNGEIVDTDKITVSGTVEDTSRNITVSVNGAAAALSGTGWSAPVSLSYGDNKIVVNAVDGANNTATAFVLVKSLAQSHGNSTPPGSSENTLEANGINDTGTNPIAEASDKKVRLIPGLAGVLIIVLLAIAFWFRKGNVWSKR
jgi:subtilase family serine protease